jgi:nucleoside-diphosphate-sugar epimerase
MTTSTNPVQPSLIPGLSQDELVVVCGGGGFIGAHLVARLQAQGYSQVRAVDARPLSQWHQRTDGVEEICADLREKDACYQCTDGAAVVFDLAADMGGMGFIEYHKADCMLSVLISAHLLQACRSNSVRRFFFASSACVYNADKQKSARVAPLRETDAYPAMCEDGYGWEKLFTERLSRHFLDEFGLETRIARYHNVFGPFGTWDGGREKAPAAICRKVAQAQISGANEIEIWGDGEQTRSFMYIDDCIEGTLRITAGEFCDAINLGSDRLVTINQLVDIVEEIAGTKLERKYNLSAPKGVRGRNSDNTLIRQILGWEPTTPLEEGLERTYAWIYSEMIAGRADPSLRALA